MRLISLRVHHTIVPMLNAHQALILRITLKAALQLLIHRRFNTHHFTTRSRWYFNAAACRKSVQPRIRQLLYQTHGRRSDVERNR